MKISATSAATIALTGFAQSSLAAPTQTTSSAPAATTTPAHYYLQILTTDNSTQSAWYGYLAPSSPPDSANPPSPSFQFTPARTDATIFTLLQDPNYGTLLQGYRDDWVAGSTNVAGTAAGGAVHQADLNLFSQGGEPVVSLLINEKNAATALQDRLGDGTVRNVSQTCFMGDGSGLPTLVVGEEVFEGCNGIGLILTPAETQEQ